MLYFSPAFLSLYATSAVRALLRIIIKKLLFAVSLKSIPSNTARTLQYIQHYLLLEQHLFLHRLRPCITIVFITSNQQPSTLSDRQSFHINNQINRMKHMNYHMKHSLFKCLVSSQHRRSRGSTKRYQIVNISIFTIQDSGKKSVWLHPNICWTAVKTTVSSIGECKDRQQQLWITQEG